MNELMESRTVAWWPVHRFVTPFLEEVGSWPMVGSLPWIRLPDDHPVKTASVLDAAQHWALRIENNQTALAEASKAISTSTDWTTVGRGRGHVYIPREVA